MLNSEVYERTVLLRELSYEGGIITDFNHQLRDSIEIVRQYAVIGTPTLLFLDGSGAELTERIVGYHTQDFYWYYFEEAINLALGKLNH